MMLPVAMPALHAAPAAGGLSLDAQGAPDFAAALAGAARDMAATMRAAETAAMDGIAGRAGVQDVVEAVMSAERTLQAALAIRDKVVSAWLDVSRMPI